jgi:hypothetical protein
MLKSQRGVALAIDYKLQQSANAFLLRPRKFLEDVATSLQGTVSHLILVSWMHPRSRYSQVAKCRIAADFDQTGCIRNDSWIFQIRAGVLQLV